METFSSILPRSAATILVGMLLMIAVAIFRKYVMPKLDGPWVAWLLVAFAAVTGLATGLATGDDFATSLTRAGEGLVAGLTSIGLYETTIKRLKSEPGLPSLEPPR